MLRSFLSEIFNDPFHQTKKGETNKTVVLILAYLDVTGVGFEALELVDGASGGVGASTTLLG